MSLPFKRLAFAHNLLAHMQATENKAKQWVYVAGKVTDLPFEDVYRKFKDAEYSLQAQGFAVLNPISFIKEDEDWQVAMRFATTLLNMCDHIYLLPDWHDSRGAKAEFSMATEFGINLLNVEACSEASKLQLVS